MLFQWQLVSESVKTKQAQNTLRAEKQALMDQLQHTSSLLDSLRTRIARDEKKVCVCIMFYLVEISRQHKYLLIMQMMGFLAETRKSTEEERQLAIGLENAKLQLADAEKEFRWLKSVASSSDKEAEEIHQDINDAKIELHNERYF